MRVTVRMVAYLRLPPAPTGRVTPVDQRPRYLLPSGLVYLDVMKVAVALEFGGIDPDSLDHDLLVSAQVRVNERQAARWMVSTLRRSRERWLVGNGDPDQLLGLRLDPDLPRLYAPREHNRPTESAEDREDDLT